MKIRYNLVPKLNSFFISILLFRILMDVSYIIFLTPVFKSDGYITDIDSIKLIESYLVLFLFIYLIPDKSEKLSLLIIQLFIVFTYIPLQSYYAISNQDRTWFWLASLFWLSIVLFYTRVHFKWKIKIIPKLIFQLSPFKAYIYLLFIALLISIVSIILIAYYSGITLNYDLSKVYAVREKFSQVDFPLSGYVINWTAKIFVPFIALFSLFYHKQHRVYPLFILACVLTFLLFSVSGHKTYLFTLPAVLIIALIVNMKNFFLKILFLCIILISSSLLFYLVTGELFLGSLVIRRTFFVPAQLSFFFYDFFSNNDLLYFSHSIFSRFFEYPYDLPPSNLISDVYLNKPETSANNGILADGFMNFGVVGIFIWALLLGVLLKVTDRIVNMKNKKVLWPLIILSFFTMVNGAFFTTLLTHGLLIVLLIAFLYPKPIQQNNELKE